MASKKDHWYGSAIMTFIASLIYLYMVFAWVANGSPQSLWLQSAGAFWLPIVGAIGVLSSIILFLLSLVGLSGRDNPAVAASTRGAALWGGFALLVIGSGGAFFWWAVAGFAIAFIGNGWPKWMG